jgi:lipopolysaccharide transport system ATP-binding protein
MAKIIFQNVYVDFPVYNSKDRSLKNTLANIATGGRVLSSDKGILNVRALDDISFSFKSGDRVGIVGHNGAGKTTLLRALCKAYTPTSGSVIVDGSVGSLIDISLGIDGEATGRENIFIRGALLGLSRSDLNDALPDILEFSELGRFIDMPVRTYSSGMHLRLAFAVSTIFRPDILLMDEWLSIGDKGFKEKSQERMNSLVSSTKIVVIATHSKELVLNTCNRAIWFEHGKIKMDGNPAEVCSTYFG